TLRDLDPPRHESLKAALVAADPGETLWRRSRHVVTENERVLEAAEALSQNDLSRVAYLMTESHASVRDNYEVSSPELDAMVEAALQSPGCLGARMTGGGFGGCTVNLVVEDAASAFSASLEERYRSATKI